MAEEPRTLPDYRIPPVIETVLGVQFSPIKSFSVPHFGLFWERLRKHYPYFEVRPPIGHILEKFDMDSSKKMGPEIELSKGPPPLRCWFMDKDKNNLVQIQSDRFIINWRKVTGKEEYPHYGTVKPKFEINWNQFCGFLNSEGFPSPKVNQCEVTYVNHLEMGKEFKSFGEMQKIFKFWSGPSSESFLPQPEQVRFNVSFVMPESKGRLHVQLEPKIRREDGQEILQLNLTARGEPNSSKLADINQWFDLGHEWIVRGFDELTKPDMHKIWGKF